MCCTGRPAGGDMTCECDQKRPEEENSLICILMTSVTWPRGCENGLWILSERPKRAYFTDWTALTLSSHSVRLTVAIRRLQTCRGWNHRRLARMCSTRMWMISVCRTKNGNTTWKNAQRYVNSHLSTMNLSQHACTEILNRGFFCPDPNMSVLVHAM